MKHIMLDLETLGVGSDSVVVSAALVEFDLTSGETGDSLHIGFNILEQLLNGGVIDNSTVTWWSTQPTEAKKLLAKSSSTEPLYCTFSKIDEFLKRNPDVSLWGNGCTFDNVILRNLYKRHNREFPLAFWQDKDVRTLTQLVNYDEVVIRTGTFIGTKHNPIDDCLHQVRMCLHAYNLITEQ